MTFVNAMTKVAKNSYKFYKVHKSSFFVGVGLAAGGAALYSGCKATAKSVREIDIANNERQLNGEDPLTKKEVFQMVGKNYISTGAWTVVSASLIIAGHHLDLKAVGVATAAAKESDNAYNALRDSVNDILVGEEDKETKAKILDKYAERKEVYGDSDQPIDIYHARPGAVAAIKGNNGTWRFKDEYGFECEGTKLAFKAAKEKFIMEGLNDISETTLADFYYCLEHYGVNVIRQPQFAYRKGYAASELGDFDISINVDEDTDGPFYMVDYDLEPTDMH